MAGYRTGRPKGLTSRAYDACVLIFQTAWERSTPVGDLPVDLAALIPPDLKRELERVFLGSFMGLFRDLGMSSERTYHDRQGELKAMGCLRRLRAGTRERLGVWALLRPPTEELWNGHVKRPFTRRREQGARELHDQRLGRFLTTLPSRHPELLAELVRAGCHTPLSVLAYLAELPERHLRARFPGGEVCVAYDVAGAKHVCGIPELDPLAPSTAGGAYKRRADHQAAMTAS